LSAATLHARTINALLAFAFVACWLSLNAWFDGEPTESDALQAATLATADAIASAQHAARFGALDPQ